MGVSGEETQLTNPKTPIPGPPPPPPRPVPSPQSQLWSTAHPSVLMPGSIETR